MKENTLPKSWCVKSDETPLFRVTVIHYLNRVYDTRFTGMCGFYYGVDDYGLAVCCREVKDYGKNVKELTIDEFISMYDSIPYQINIPKGKKVVKVLAEGDIISVILQKDNPSLKFENLSKANLSKWTIDIETSRKQMLKVKCLAQLMAIANEANQTVNWMPQYGEKSYSYTYCRYTKNVVLQVETSVTYSPINFKSKALAEQAYEENTDIFLTYYRP